MSFRFLYVLIQWVTMSNIII